MNKYMYKPSVTACAMIGFILVLMGFIYDLTPERATVLAVLIPIGVYAVWSWLYKRVGWVIDALEKVNGN